MNDQQVAAKFLSWLKEFNPVLWATVKVKRPDLFNAAHAKGLGYLAADETSTVAPSSAPWYSGILTSIADTVKAVLPIYQQKKIIDTQVKLLSQGKAPLTNEQIMAAGTTSLQVQLSPDIEKQVVATAKTAQSGINWTTMALLAGGGFLVWQLTQPKGRRR